MLNSVTFSKRNLVASLQISPGKQLLGATEQKERKQVQQVKHSDISHSPSRQSYH